MWCIYKTLEFFKSTPESFPDQFVHRDELSYQSKYKKPNFFFGEKQYDHLHQPLLDQIKGDHVDDFKGADHHHHHQLGDKKVNMRVKIKMTKEEARRLVAKCKDQKGTLEFRDVALELVKIPPHRILEVTTIESSTTTCPS